ncbi:hypothetical protein ORJ04_22655, partial [Rheinheimera baltica]
AKHYLLRKNTAARQPFAKCQKRLNHRSGNVILSVISVTPTAAYVAVANCRSVLPGYLRRKRMVKPISCSTVSAPIMRFNGIAKLSLRQ